MPTMLEPSTCHYIPITSLRHLDLKAAEAIEAFCNYDNNDITWGDANRTMVDIPTFLRTLFDAVECAELLDENGEHWGYNCIEKALDEYRDEVYIDLEN